MAIPSSFIMQLRQTADIQDIVSSYCSITRAGRNQKCLCPFHSEKTPSMVIYPDTQSFYCFGCGAGGDVITFIMKIENLDYVEAVRFLARRYHMEIPDEAGDDRAYRMRTRILELNRETARFYHKCLLSPAGKEGLAYLKGRQLSEKTITTYGLGFAPMGWDNLINHLRSKGFTMDEMIAAAVVARSDRGGRVRFYDQFRNRVMFPIIDLRGNVIAFGGRVMDDSKPKYLNSADTPVFKKSRNLFSLNLAKTQVQDRKLILAEGYMDVISIYQAGFHNVIATLGTALTEEQARLISQYAEQVIISYDSDVAGQRASERAITLLSQAGVVTRVLAMSGAKDPDEYIKKFGPTRFKLLLEGANNPVEFELLKVKKTLDMNTEDGKLTYLRQSVLALARLSNPFEREVYAGKIAEETGVSKATILEQVQGVMKRERYADRKREWNEVQSGRALYQDRVNPQKATNLKAAMAEEGILVYLFKNPDAVDEVAARLKPEYFVTDFNRRVYELILQKAGEQHTVDLASLSGELNPQEMGKISGLLAKNHDMQNSRQMLDDYLQVLEELHEKPKPSDLAQAGEEELEAYYERLKQKKGGR